MTDFNNPRPAGSLPIARGYYHNAMACVPEGPAGAGCGARSGLY